MESRTSKQKEMIKSVQSVLSETLSYPAMSIPNRGAVQTARGDGQVAVRDACFVGQRCLALLMSADAMWRYLSLGRRNWDASGILMTAKGKTRHKGKARWRGARQGDAEASRGRNCSARLGIIPRRLRRVHTLHFLHPLARVLILR